MAIRTTPATIITVCDACGITNEKGDPFNDRCRLSVSRVFRDFQGGIVGGQDIDRDLCDACASKVIKAINASISELGPDGSKA